MLGWFAVRVKPRHEKNVSGILKGKGIDSLLPLYWARQRWSDRTKDVNLPLFPGYVFCNFDPAQRVPVVNTPGVFDIVRIGRVPAPVDPQEVAALQLLMRSGIASQPWPRLEIGDAVEVEYGPLMGCTGVLVEIKNRMRLQISVSLLCRAVLVEVDRECVRRIPPHYTQAGRAMHNQQSAASAATRYFIA